jgi:hypothetical protein
MTNSAKVMRVLCLEEDAPGASRYARDSGASNVAIHRLLTTKAEDAQLSKHVIAECGAHWWPKVPLFT